MRIGDGKSFYLKSGIFNSNRFIKQDFQHQKHKIGQTFFIWVTQHNITAT